MRLSGTCRAVGSAKATHTGGVRPTVWLAVTSLMLGATGQAFAQGSFQANPATTSSTPRPATRVSYTPEQTRSIIDDLSNGFMDDFSRRLPGGIDPRNPAPAVGTPTAEMRKLRPLVREFADEVSQLVYELNDELRRIPTIRPLLTDALRVSALAVSLDRAIQSVNDHRVIVQDVRDLDASWRELSYRLNNVRGMARGTMDRIASLNLINDDIDSTLGIKPQFNREALIQKTYTLAQDLRNLTEDVQVELGSRESQPFILSLNRARQQILNMVSLLDQQSASSEQVVNEYKRFQALWYPERVKLQAFNNTYLERSLRRITQTDGEIHQLLLLPTKVDSQQLLYLTSALKKDIDQFFDRTSLRLLMNMPQSNRVAGVASEFYGVCEHFVDEVQRNSSHDQLVESFRYIESAQRNFVSLFSNIPSNEALAALRQIEQTIASLSSALRVQQGGSFDRQRVIEVLARVESDISQLEWAANNWLSYDRQSFANACLQSIRQMRQQTQQMNQDIVRGNVSTQQLNQQAEQLYETWRTVYNYLIRCQTEDRTNLGRIASRITPSLVELRTMVQF